jgi:hypothetical protein
MSYAEKHIVDITTAADGSATAYTPVVKGRIQSISYVKDGTTPFDNGVDFTITTEDSLQGVWAELNVNASKTVAPRQATHDNAGVASLFAAAGDSVEDHIVAATERIKIVIAQGGNVKLGRFIVVVA